MLRQILPLSVLPAKIHRRLMADLLKRESITRKIYGIPMILPLRTEGIGTALAIYGERELDQRAILNRVLGPGETVLDIGANIGYYALLEFARVGPRGRIYAYEPDQRNLDVLHRNIALNNAQSVIEAIPEAVSDSEGIASFHLASKANLNALEPSRDHMSEVLTERYGKPRRYVGQIEVRKRDVGDILATCARPVTLIRMDLEGHEVAILQSILRALDNGRLQDRAPQHVLFEPHSWEYTGAPNSLERVLTGLARHGYEVAALGTRDERSSPIAPLGYRAQACLPEKRGVTRGIYWNLPQEDAVRLAACVDGVTTVLVSRRRAAA